MLILPPVVNLINVLQLYFVALELYRIENCIKGDSRVVNYDYVTFIRLATGGVN